MRRTALTLVAATVVAGCGASTVDHGQVGPAATVTPGVEARVACIRLKSQVEATGGIERFLADTRQPSTQVGGLQFIKIFREQMALASASGCDLDSAEVLMAAQSLARVFWMSEEGFPQDLRDALEPPTAAWILSLDPKEQEEARTDMVQTVLLYRAANQRTIIVYRGSSTSGLADFRLESEIRSLKNQLIAAGVTVY